MELSDSAASAPIARSSKAAAAESVLAGGGEMGALMRSIDWSRTALGAVERWPQSLRTMVSTCLASRFPIVLWWGPELVMLYNDGYRPMLGAKHPASMGQRGEECWTEIWHIIGPMLAGVLERGEATWSDDQMLPLERNGYAEECYFTFSYSPIRDETGGVGGVFCAVTETTERVLGERRLATLRELAAALGAARDERELLAALGPQLAANAKDLPFALTYFTDDDGTHTRRVCATGIALDHPAAPERVDVGSASDLWSFAAARSEACLVHLAELPIAAAAMPTGAWDTPPRLALVVPIGQGQDGPAGFLVAGLNPYRLFDAEERGFVTLVAGQIASSLANVREYEAERQRARALAELDLAKTRFFSNVSHEFRTPLTLLLGPVEEALSDAELAGVNRDRLEVVARNARRLMRLVNTLLDFSRIEAGRVDAHYEPLDLAAFTSELASSFRSAVQQVGLRLVVDAPRDGVSAYVDRDMWEKIVLNLLSNALKHTFAGEIAVRVAARAGRATLEVRDTGVGIAADELPRVFERFHRVPNARSRTHEGTGIGLALVQELVKLHGGAIEVTSAVDVGTTFTVSIPLGKAHLPPDHVVAPSSRRAAAGTRAAAYVEEALRWLPDEAAEPAEHEEAATVGARILVADDNADMREYIVRLLRERGWSVEAVANGRAALERTRASRPDVVVSDVMMPELDGLVLVAALRADAATSTIPVILLSARAGEEAREEGLHSGADDYLVKPFVARELFARVEGQLRRAATLAEERRQADEQRRLRAVLQEERARLSELLRQAPAAVAVLRGPDHVYEMANDYYLRLVGERDIVGKPIREALPELAGQGIFELLDRVYETGEPYVGHQFPLLIDAKGDGVLEEIYFNFVYQPVRAPDGSVSAVFVHAVDVTPLVEARRAAEAANQSKSDFLASMSHELRTPLNAIGGYAQLLEMGLHGPITPAQRAVLARVKRAQSHLLELINDLLNYTKLERGRVEYDIKPIALADAARGVLPLIEPQMEAKGLTLHVRLGDEATDGHGAIVAADPEKLAQVLVNLLSNAIKFTPARQPDGSPGEVALEVDDTAPEVAQLRVRDTGIGIAPEKHESIFDPFVQVRTGYARDAEGTGLGLAISRELARGMGGDISVRSALGAGAEFTVTLRRA